MTDTAEFTGQVGDAYEHLYDLVYLGSHPLGKLITPGALTRRRESAWKLHQTLLEAIQELNPGPQAPTFSREWRRHRLMVLRYVDGQTPEVVADQLAVSRRQYYRMHEAAIEALAGLLWNRVQAPVTETVPASPDTDRHEPTTRLELIRLEAAQIIQASRYARIADVIQGVLTILDERLSQQTIQIELALPVNLPDVAVDRSLLRQMFLAIFGYLIEHAEHTVLRLTAQVEAATVNLSVSIDPSFTVNSADHERLDALQELAALNEVRLIPLTSKDSRGFNVHLPARSRRTVLVIDDNADVLELFQRYLSLHDFQPITARTADEALTLARRLRPFAITLDLMMPDQDGWDLLQAFLNRAETQHIPIIVCSVLRQKELALSLGATAFLEKPISEQALLSVLDALDKR